MCAIICTFIALCMTGLNAHDRWLGLLGETDALFELLDGPIVWAGWKAGQPNDGCQVGDVVCAVDVDADANWGWCGVLDVGNFSCPLSGT